MNVNSPMRRLAKPGRMALVAGVATLLVGAALTVPAATAGATTLNTKTVLTSSTGTHPAVSGQAVTFTATVDPLNASGRVAMNAPTPQGTVAFTVTGSDSPSDTPACDNTNTPSLNGGTASCTLSNGLLATGSTYQVTATYTDTVDSNDNGSANSLTQTVNPGKTTTGVTSSSNPSTSAEPVTFTATVSIVSPATGTLSGNVTFSGVSCDGGNSVPVDAGLAQCIISGGLSAAGSPYSVTATYGPDPEFANSTSTAVHQVVDQGTDTVTLASTPNTCNGDICTTAQGTPLTFTATVSAGTGTPVGPVNFVVIPAGKKAKDGLTCDGGNSVTLSGGQATCTFANGLPATVYYTVTATLADPNYQTASATLYENTSLLSTDTSVSVQKNVTAGETFAVTATVTPLASSSNPPTGGVDITVCGGNSNGDNGCQGAIEPVTGDTAVLEVGGGEFPGKYAAYATYVGDQNYLGSSAKKAPFSVAQAPTTIAIQSSENPSIDGDAVTLTATITAANGGADSTLVGPPTGNLDFTITGPSGSYTCQDGNSVPLDNGQADEDVAQCFLPAGTLTDPAAPTGNTNYTVKVSYASDGDFLSSHSSLTQVVVPAID